MEIDSMPFLLVTANVGSVFEDPSRLLQSWIKEFLSKINLLKPHFLALHLQEVGGKTYEKSMEYVQEFIKNLCESEELSEYNKIRVYLDEDYNSAEHFTALGNLYFVHHAIENVKIWNFLTHEWETVEGKNIHTGNIEAVATKEKSKFPQHFFPECKWSRKGFLRTRWELNCTVIDFVNIHLFHDASNLAACEEFPSVYCKSRRRALVHTLERFHTDLKNGVAPYFIFGDFNFRCDTSGVIKKLTEDLSVHRVQNIKNDSTKVHYRTSEGHNVLTVGKKEFNHIQHQTIFKESWLQQFDRELEPLREVLVEYPITFPSSYPYEEDPEMPKNYMPTRCPAWCDRILLSPTARDMIVDDSFSSTDYNIVGENICMGDHKPVYLCIHVKTLQGTVRCCYCYEHASQPGLEINNVDYMNQKLAYCSYSSEQYCKILLECCNLDKIIEKNTILRDVKSNNNRNDEHFLSSFNTQGSRERQPLVSINVIDVDNYNICMCTIYSGTNTETGSYDGNSPLDGSICSECRNIIKKQPTEHRCTLISKRVLLANNIIVNRVDTHYLTTYTDNRREPYTPESAESHSPCPELELNCQHNNFDEENQSNNVFNNIDIPSKENVFNSSDSRGVVSPRQLKSRLEHLQRVSLNSDLDEIDTNSKPNRCCDRCCIL